MFSKEIDFIKAQYPTKDFIALHEPCFDAREIELTKECIESTFVSSIGKFVNDFEIEIAKFCNVKKAVACVNGTNALHMALLLAGVKEDDIVATQALTFIATANAISYCNAQPAFIDIDRETLGLCPNKLEDFIKKNPKVKAVVPMHTFGLPCKIAEIKSICEKYKVALIEDCAESLGSFVNGVHTGNFGSISAISFNGNKIITTGGGGMLLFNNEDLAAKAKHLTTQAKVPHRWEFNHDEIGYNYRMPNLNAALGVAQLEKLPIFLEKKRALAQNYKDFFGERFISEPENTQSNYWLNALLFSDRKERDAFLEETNNNKVMTRPVWTLMNRLRMFKDAPCSDLSNAEYVEQRLVNIPSGVVL